MDVFVYGTLTDPETAASVLSTVEYRGEARLSGLHRVDGEYPTLAPGGTVQGRLLVTDELDRLDSYEGVERGLYVRVSVPRQDESADKSAAATPERVVTYVGDPDRLGVPDEWPGDGPFAERVRTYLDEHDVDIRI
jgi:gamma-glutamylaminecyclotransferase